jgi:hypothetical protein
LDFAEEFRLVLKTSSANFAPDDLTFDSGHSVRVARFENPSFFRPKPRFSAVDRVFGTHSMTKAIRESAEPDLKLINGEAVEMIEERLEKQRATDTSSGDRDDNA